jgi:hypothetical protein
MHGTRLRKFTAYNLEMTGVRPVWINIDQITLLQPVDEVPDEVIDFPAELEMGGDDVVELPARTEVKRGQPAFTYAILTPGSQHRLVETLDEILERFGDE